MQEECILSTYLLSEDLAKVGNNKHTAGLNADYNVSDD